MQKDLLEILKKFSTKTKEDNFEKFLEENATNNSTLLIQLLILYFNDLNSSTLREIVTAELSGFKHLDAKIGYDGFRKVPSTLKTEYCEIKPVNLRINKDGTLNKKFNGSGNFTDFSWKKLERIKNDNVKMILSGFLEGKLLYIISFNFAELTFMNKLANQLTSKFPDGDKSGFWLRSANFNYLDYRNSQSLKMIFLDDNIDEYKFAFVKDFFELLKNMQE